MSQSRIWLKYAKGVLIEKEKLSQVWGCGTELEEEESHPAGQVLDFVEERHLDCTQPRIFVANV